ncbi:hypothetical protein IT400_04515 [Candidatus Nomurabacteria bacterium]|nr:hypothetical protein [Candidatus Nomurabacteria bacterium]
MDKNFGENLERRTDKFDEKLMYLITEQIKLQKEYEDQLEIIEKGKQELLKIAESAVIENHSTEIEKREPMVYDDFFEDKNPEQNLPNEAGIQPKVPNGGNESRRKFLKNLGKIVLGTGATAIAGKKVINYIEKKSENKKEIEAEKKDSGPEVIEVNHKREIIPWYKYKDLTPKLEFRYKSIIPELKIEGLKMVGKTSANGASGIEGKILRSLRFQNVANAVEGKYNLPKNLIVAMIMQESTGMDLLPNGADDGGFGLCHMQGDIAREFHLKTYGNCNERRCKNGHAIKLRNLIEENNHDRKLVVDKDDRLHPILNLDAAGRMIACYMAQPPITGGKLAPLHLDALQSAVARYSGAKNYKDYWKNVSANIKLLNNKKGVEKVRKIFNAKNEKLIINGGPGNFDIYIKKSEEQNINYGLESYKKGKYYESSNSKKMAKKYKNSFK